MELRSGRYIASGEARRRVELGRTLSGPDHLSALPDELLLLVLARLRCVPTAAATCVLARRWRGLWTQLLGLHFRDVPFRSVAACFQSATSLSLSTGNHQAELRVPVVAVGSPCLFPALTTVDLHGYFAADCLAALVVHCPRLRVLRYAVRHRWPCGRDYAITVHSPSLRELVVKESKRVRVRRVNVVAPALDQLTMSFRAGDGLTVSVSAPVAEKVSWHCRGWLGHNTRLILTSSTPERRRPPLLRIEAFKGVEFFHDMPVIKDELEKHLRLQVAVDLSSMDLELRIKPWGHVYGPLVFDLLGMERVRSAAQKLKLALLPRDHMREEKRWRKCNSCELVNWRSQTISMTKLEEVEIDGFQGDDHEFDFLDLVFRCTPTLRRMAVKWSSEVVAPSDAKILNVFKAHPSVECHVSSS